MSQTATQPQRQMEYIQLGELELLELRDIRQHVVEDIAERIDDDEYNPARPLRVVPNGDSYQVVDGNHRVSALRQLEDIPASKPIPCVVEPEDADVYALSHASNKDEDTYAEEDLFDHLDFIGDLREAHTQAEIAERLGWGESKVKDYSALLSKIVAGVLEIAKEHQDGRATGEVASATFSEYWFRTSGLYDLNRDGVDQYALPDEDEPKHAQLRVMEWFVDDQNCDATKAAVQKKVDHVETICQQLDKLADELNAGVDDEEREELREEIVAGTYTMDTLGSAIKNANESAKDRADYGTDAIEGLRSLEANSVDCVVMDPPYGVDYESHRDSGRASFEDSEDDALALIDDVCAELERVCTANAHIYVFFAMRQYENVRKVIGDHFDIQPVPLVWTKHNHAPTRDAEGGFKKMYAHKYEPIFVARAPNGDERELNGGVSPNVLKHARPSGDGRWHDAQKPRSLLGELIENSTGKRETVLDPFAGSGSTLLAAAERDRHYIGFEVDESYESDFTRELREVTAHE